MNSTSFSLEYFPAIADSSPFFEDSKEILIEAILSALNFLYNVNLKNYLFSTQGN